MMRMICDGCFANGIVNDLTGKETQALSVQLSPADILHLCPERCAVLYKENKDEVRLLQSETIRNYHAKNAALKEKLWEMFKNVKKNSVDAG